MHISEVEAYRRDKEHLTRNEGKHPANYSSEEKARNEMIKKFHEEDDDVSRVTIDVNRMEQLKKEGKDPKDYGYDPNGGYLR